MNIEVEQLSNVERKIAVSIPWEAVKAELDAAYQGLQRKARVKGFRPGKVPRKVLEQFYRPTVESEVVNRLVDEGMRQAISEHDLFLIDRPVLEEAPKIAVEQPLAFSLKVTVKPHVDPERYKGLEVERKIREVTEAEVDAELAALREKASVVEPITDRNVAEQGDLAVVDFFGFVDGETFKGGKGINYTVELGGGRMIPGFEDAIVGMKIGDEKTFPLRFPEGDGPEEARGKDVEWKVELKELKSKAVPELDDEFAKDLGEFDTLAELRDGVRKNLATREDGKSQRLLRSQVVEALVAANPLEVPDRMVDNQVEFLLRDTIGVSTETRQDPQFAPIVAELAKNLRPQAEQQVKTMLLLEGVARVEGLSVSEADVDGKLQSLSREHRIPLPQLRNQLRENGQMGNISYNLLQEKAVQLVMEAAQITDRTVTAEELSEALQEG